MTTRFGYVCGKCVCVCVSIRFDEATKIEFFLCVSLKTLKTMVSLRH